MVPDVTSQVLPVPRQHVIQRTADPLCEVGPAIRGIQSRVDTEEAYE